jgi:hypothetical protein
VFLIAAVAVVSLASVLASHVPGADVGLIGAMAIQTAYNETMARGLPGMVATMNNWDADTGVCETSAGIGFGLACGQGVADNGVTLGGAAAADFRGVSVRDVTLDPLAVDKYVLGTNVALLTRGDVWVTVDGAVNAGDNVTFVATTGALGSVAADGTHFTVDGARWMTSAASGGIARLRLSGKLPSA